MFDGISAGWNNGVWQYWRVAFNDPSDKYTFGRRMMIFGLIYASFLHSIELISNQSLLWFL